MEKAWLQRSQRRSRPGWWLALCATVLSSRCVGRKALRGSSAAFHLLVGPCASMKRARGCLALLCVGRARVGMYIAYGTPWQLRLFRAAEEELRISHSHSPSSAVTHGVLAGWSNQQPRLQKAVVCRGWLPRQPKTNSPNAQTRTWTNMPMWTCSGPTSMYGLFFASCACFLFQNTTAKPHSVLTPMLAPHVLPLHVDCCVVFPSAWHVALTILLPDGAASCAQAAWGD